METSHVCHKSLTWVFDSKCWYSDLKAMFRKVMCFSFSKLSSGRYISFKSFSNSPPSFMVAKPSIKQKTLENVWVVTNSFLFVFIRIIIEIIEKQTGHTRSKVGSPAKMICYIHMKWNYSHKCIFTKHIIYLYI